MADLVVIMDLEEVIRYTVPRVTLRQALEVKVNGQVNHLLLKIEFALK